MSGETFYRSSINLEIKGPTSSEVAYSNQSTRTLTTTHLQTYIQTRPRRMNQQKSFSHFGRGCRLISADA